jgi:cytochrome bd-type quinol oxidase subunit 1
VSVTEIWISIGVFALLYAALGAADLVLMLRYSRRKLPADVPEPRAAVPALTY